MKEAEDHFIWLSKKNTKPMQLCLSSSCHLTISTMTNHIIQRRCKTTCYVLHAARNSGEIMSRKYLLFASLELSGIPLFDTFMTLHKGEKPGREEGMLQAINNHFPLRLMQIMTSF